MKTENQSRDKGLTLIELTIVMAIIAILTVMAIPSYQNHMKKVRRTDATNSLLQVLSKQELFYSTQNTTYTLDVNALGYTAYLGDEKQTTSDQKHYIIRLSACGAGVNGCVLLTATAAPTSSQKKDTSCASISLNSFGLKKSGDAEGNTTHHCW